MTSIQTGLPARILRLLISAFAVMLLAGCGGGGSGGSATSGTPTGSPTSAPNVTNFTTVTIDAGPAALGSGPNGYRATNTPYVSVTICAPGLTTNCQTIDHVLVDTGSIGLRLIQPVLDSTLLGAMPAERDPSGNPVGECYDLVSGYLFGSVRLADFRIGGESVRSMPVQVIGDTGAFASVPSTCSSGGGTELNTVQLLGANGILGIGTARTDCGPYCTVNGGSGAAAYYDCPSGGCGTIIARAASTAPPYEQLPNPVAAFAADNNGTILSLPGVPAAGTQSVTGTLYFGIGTQANNALGSATVLASNSAGLFTANYKGYSLPNSYLDSGSNVYYFEDSSITACTGANFNGFYCPASPLVLSPTLVGTNGSSASGQFTLYNAQTQPAATSNVIPGIGVNPGALNFPYPITKSFDFGLPFFLGRNVYTAIEGRSAGPVVGPYVAF